MTIELKFTELEAVSLAMGKEATRYYLCGVYVTSHYGFARLVATDGHRLHMIDTDRHYEGNNAILPDSFVKQILLMRKSECKAEQHDSFTLTIGNMALKAEYKSNVINGTGIGSAYPQYEKVIPDMPKEPNAPCVAFNTNYVADFGKACKIYTGAKTPAIKLTPSGNERAPYLVTFGDCEAFTGVLVPMKI